MRYLSVCSGIEAASVAWESLGWTPVAFAEIEKFPSQVLAHHFPHVPNLGDMTKYKDWNIDRNAVDLIVGGTPCQSFSVAGLRKGLEDPRGNLALTFIGMVDHYRPEWVIWENVPGVLSSSGGRDFGSFLGALGQLGYGFAYRVLDAQYFGVPITRKRVFVIGHIGASWSKAFQVLFVHANGKDGKKRGRAFPRSHSLTTENAGSRNARGNLIQEWFGLRGMTPVETERALGFPDGWTDILPTTPDGPRYKALGNSMAVPVMRFIGGRINEHR